MKTILIENTEARFPFRVELLPGVTQLVGDSGTGKTYLFSLIADDMKLKSKRCLLVTPNSKTDVISGHYDLIILDKLDLYYTPELMEMYLQHTDYVLCACRLLLELYGCVERQAEVTCNSGVLEVSYYGIHF